MLPRTKPIKIPSLRKDTNLEQKTLDNSIRFQRLFNSNFFVYSSLSDVLSKFILFVQQEIIISIPLKLSLNRLNLENKVQIQNSIQVFLLSVFTLSVEPNLVNIAVLLAK